mgnify:CR=1 FL=1
MQNKFVHLMILAFLFVVPLISFAQLTIDTCDDTGKICNPLERTGVNSIEGFVKVFLEGALKIGIPVIALAVIYSGFLFVAARGNPESITKAKDTLLYTLIGAAILIGSWAIAKLISETVLGLS